MKNLAASQVFFSPPGACKEDIDSYYGRSAGDYLLKPSDNKELVEKLSQIFSYWIDAVETTP